VIHSDNSFATVAFLRINGARLDPKSVTNYEISVPPNLDDEYDLIRKAVLQSQKATPVTLPPNQTKSIFIHPDNPVAKSRRNGRWVTISNVQATSLPNNATIEEEVTSCFRVLSGKLYNVAKNIADRF